MGPVPKMQYPETRPQSFSVPRGCKVVMNIVSIKSCDTLLLLVCI